MYDIAIIGAGIIGTLIARDLSRYDLKVIVLEKQSDVAEGATGANSAMIHSGHDPRPGTLKCHYNLLGSRMFPELCRDLQVAYAPIGAYVAATDEEEEGKLDVLISQCRERNVPFEVLNGDEARKYEPNLSEAVCKVLSLPTTAVVAPWEVAIAAMEEAMLNGVELELDHEVKSISKQDGVFIIDEKIRCSTLINCAGVHCQKITEMLRPSPYKVEARKGEYFVLDHLNGSLVKRVIYPAPSEKGKGILVVPTVHGNVLLGPNSDYCEDIDDVSTGQGLDLVRQQVTRIVKNIPFNRMIHTFAGLRPHIDLKDFYIREDDMIEGFVHVAGIESPGLSSAPAIARDVVEKIVLPRYPSCRKKSGYNRRRPFIDIKEMDDESVNELIKQDPDFGKLVCRCEKISKGEIKDVINRKCGARTVKGVKMRCRPGMGRCQGGFCEPEVVKILAEELGKDIRNIELNRQGSNICVEDAKEEL